MSIDNPNDKVYTPDFIVDEVLSIFLPKVGKSECLLEPFKGKGAFYNKMPLGRTDWCEIDEGKDFFDYDKSVDWIITNPPYSIFKQVLPKALEVSDNIVLVIPINKLLSSMPRLMDIKRAGFGIKHIHYLGSGRQLKFPFGFPVGAVYIKKGFEGSVDITYDDRCYNAKGKAK
jgi:hypothetical protein